jgi:colicin import membrane protein
MEIEIFKAITTEGVVASIEENSEKYHKGFFADMNDRPQRVLVNASAKDIGDIIKQVERARIDISKANKIAVDKEAVQIIDRLKKANEPFTVLIDEYKAEHKKVLDAEKEHKATLELIAKIESDHEFGLLMNKTFEYDREQERLSQEKVSEDVRIEAERVAEAKLKMIAESKERMRVASENARLADTEHKRKINNEAVTDLISNCSLNEDQAKAVIKMIANKRISNTQINY